MANIDANRLFHSSRIVKSISRTKVPQAVLSTAWGLNIGGRNTNPVGGNVAAYDIFDKTRTLATGRARGSGPSVQTRNPAGQKSITMHRSFEKFNLLDDEVFRRRPIGGDYGEVDLAGQKYVSRQEDFLAQRFKNMREFMVSRMAITGGFGLLPSGQDLIPVESGTAGSITVSYQMPAGNLTQLDMLGAGSIISISWATAATATPIRDCLDISAAMEQLAGYPLAHVWCDSTVWAEVTECTEVINLAGSAASPFEYIRRDPSQVNEDGIQTDYFEAVLRGAPWITWHISNAVLDVNGTVTKTFGGTKALFTPEMSNDIVEMYEGSEMIRENANDGGTERFGFHAWTTPTIDPAGRDLKAIDNCIPVLYKPDAIACGTVVF